MQPLESARRLLTWHSMCPATSEPSTVQRRLAYIAYTLAVFVVNVMSFCSTLAFCWKYATIDFNGSTYALMVAIGALGWIYIMTAAILMCHQIADIFATLSTIYKHSKCSSNRFK